MKIVIPGGTGHLGQLLAHHLRSAGHSVVTIGRSSKADVVWDGRTLGAWAREIDGADVVINLAGRSVNCRYNERTRREIVSSRVESTTVVGAAIAQSAKPPCVWLQMSTATIYDHSFDVANDEITGRIGEIGSDAPGDWAFSVSVGRAWESAVDAANTPLTRKVKLRTGLVMAPGAGGAFDVFHQHVRHGLGRLGSGDQMMSWIHGDDFCAAIDFLIHVESLDGVVNVTAPGPLPTGAFIDVLRLSSGRWPGLPINGALLRFGAWVMRTEPELILKSRFVIPTRLLEHGFRFSFPQWPAAAADLVARAAEAA
jgi:uncharacterized protein